MMSAGLAITAIAAFTVFSVPALTNMMFNIDPGGYCNYPVTNTFCNFDKFITVKPKTRLGLLPCILTKASPNHGG